MNIATLRTGFAAFEVYRSLSFDEAEYQGETLLYYFSVAAPVIIWSVIAWELICLIGVRRWKDIGAGIAKRKRGLLCIAVAAIATVCIGSFCYFNTCETQYFDEVVEFYGIPDGVGDPLTEEQRKERAGYWRIDDYPGKHRLILTYVDAYGQLELMRQYSTAYDRMLFQPVARIEYCYKKSKDKYRKADNHLTDRVLHICPPCLFHIQKRFKHGADVQKFFKLLKLLRSCLIAYPFFFYCPD